MTHYSFNLLPRALSVVLLGAALAALAYSPTGRAQALVSNQLDSIVALVEEDVILRSELDTAVSNIMIQYADRQAQLPPRNILEKQVLERLVLLRLQLQRAEAGGIRVGDGELEQAIRSIAQQNRITPEQMRAQLARDGMDFAEFRRNLRDEIISQRLRQSVIQNRVNVTDTEIDIALASDSMKTGQVRIGLILIAVPDGATQEQISTALTKAEGVRDLVTSGKMEFSAAAIRYSDAPNALEGGDIGWRSFDEMPPMFANVVEGMSKGDLTPPIRGQSGYHLLKLIDSRDQQQQETVTEYRARDILIRAGDLVSMDEAKRKIDEIHARIKAGEKFEDLARTLSDDTMTKNAGGDMGWFHAYAWGNAVGEQVLQLSDGEVSEPFRTEAGWHLIQRLESRVQDVTEESKRNRAREMLARRKSDEEMERFLRQLREESFVELRLGS
ncbi:peptidylprolyl isomerase [Pseudomarimonas arenosa]|uniref:Chaperone SurA n=1 Tax=Pseudomarimonas arenosa TaxID=2774145 RepID=A0AAW3ZMT1_9GAMM|nr:peptidylprolyl isomerase [Pseudomarimonas arenosa]MBD8525952.1 peptidylprolyl isomerase [Pseudomarimonas arenosa]